RSDAAASNPACPAPTIMHPSATVHHDHDRHTQAPRRIMDGKRPARCSEAPSTLERSPQHRGAKPPAPWSEAPSTVERSPQHRAAKSPAPCSEAPSTVERSPSTVERSAILLPLPWRDLDREAIERLRHLDLAAEPAVRQSLGIRDVEDGFFRIHDRGKPVEKLLAHVNMTRGAHADAAALPDN